MSGARPLVAIVDDDESVRESLPGLLSTLGFDARAFSSAEEFLGALANAPPRCLILDIALPGMTGPELQGELASRGARIPIIFITADANHDVRSSLMSEGAVECLFKPFSEGALLDALRAALA